MLAAAQQEDDGAFFFSHPPPSHSSMHGSYVQPGGAAVLFSWKGEVTAQPCGGEEEEEVEEEEMGRAVCWRGAQPRGMSGAAAAARIQSHPRDLKVQYQLLSVGGGSCKAIGTRAAFASIVNTWKHSHFENRKGICLIL